MKGNTTLLDKSLVLIAIIFLIAILLSEINKEPEGCQMTVRRFGAVVCVDSPDPPAVRKLGINP